MSFSYEQEIDLFLIYSAIIHDDDDDNDKNVTVSISDVSPQYRHSFFFNRVAALQIISER